MAQSLTLGFSCPDQPGIVHSVSSFIVTVGGNITESQQYEDRDTELFFMRVAFDVADEIQGASGKSRMNGEDERIPL